jgi:serine/threonine protein kinase
MIAERFLTQRKLGGGSFGDVYSATDIQTNREVALKVEANQNRNLQLQAESKFYQRLEGGIGIPHHYWFGKDRRYNVLAIERLGDSLEVLRARQKSPFSLKTVLMIADQTLSQIQYIHSHNIIHRDIKPENFLMGVGGHKNVVYIIDFGLSKDYRNPQTGVHIPYCTGRSLTGTARYASLGAMTGQEQSRRDDLEALGYLWMYFLRTSLPWSTVVAQNQAEKLAKILEKKRLTSFESLCEGFPSEFVTYFQMVRQLKFEEEPPYAAFRAMFRNLFLRCRFTYDYKYDWSSGSVRVSFKPPMMPVVAEPPALPTVPQSARENMGFRRAVPAIVLPNEKAVDHRPRRLTTPGVSISRLPVKLAEIPTANANAETALASARGLLAPRLSAPARDFLVIPKLVEPTSQNIMLNV